MCVNWASRLTFFCWDLRVVLVQGCNCTTYTTYVLKYLMSLFLHESVKRLRNINVLCIFVILNEIKKKKVV